MHPGRNICSLNAKDELVLDQELLMIGYNAKDFLDSWRVLDNTHKLKFPFHVGGK